MTPSDKRDRATSRAYSRYSEGRQTLHELSERCGKSVRTLRRAFDLLPPASCHQKPSAEPVALTFDGTFFGRGCGLMVYRALSRNIHWQEIESETLAVVETGLKHLMAQGWCFSSMTVDGRKGTISLIKRLFPDMPVQFCLFHQKAIIRRYLTTRPKTICGKELRELTRFLGYVPEKLFMECLDDIRDRYVDFLKERNELGQFKHRKLRSALRSLRLNASNLFAYQKFPERAIPTTTNSCDGSFAHWKNKVKIHRGLRPKRRLKMIHFLLSNS